MRTTRIARIFVMLTIGSSIAMIGAMGCGRSNPLAAGRDAATQTQDSATAPPDETEPTADALVGDDAVAANQDSTTPHLDAVEARAFADTLSDEPEARSFADVPAEGPDAKPEPPADGPSVLADVPGDMPADGRARDASDAREHRIDASPPEVYPGLEAGTKLCPDFTSQTYRPCCPATPPDCTGKPDGYPGYMCTPDCSNQDEICWDTMAWGACSCSNGRWMCLG